MSANHLAARIIPATHPLVAGQWFEIRFMPDLGTEEGLNIGVAFVDGDGNIHSKLLGDTAGLRTIWRQYSAESIAFLLRLLEATLRGGERCPPSPHLLYGCPRFAQGESIRAILDDAFTTTVTVAQLKQTRRHREASRDTAAVRKEVLAALRKIGGERAETIIAGQSAIVTDATGQAHALDLPLIGEGLSGSIVSGCYRSGAIIEVNMLRAAIELETAARVIQPVRRGLFVLRSGQMIMPGPSDRQRSSDNRIERIERQLHQIGVHVGVASQPDRLAEKILAWAESA